jgi:hypothetical protein
MEMQRQFYPMEEGHIPNDFAREPHGGTLPGARNSWSQNGKASFTPVSFAISLRELATIIVEVIK